MNRSELRVLTKEELQERNPGLAKFLRVFPIFGAFITVRGFMPVEGPGVQTEKKPVKAGQEI